MAKTNKKQIEHPSHKSRMRRFLLIREEDVSGVSGTGPIAEGTVYSTGQAVLCWLTHLSSVAVYHSLDVLKAVHGHEGKTTIVFLDEEANE